MQTYKLVKFMPTIMNAQTIIPSKMCGRAGDPESVQKQQNKQNIVPLRLRVVWVVTLNIKFLFLKVVGSDESTVVVMCEIELREKLQNMKTPRKKRQAKGATKNKTKQGVLYF